MNASMLFVLVISSHLIVSCLGGWNPFEKSDGSTKNAKCPIVTQLRDARDKCIEEGHLDMEGYMYLLECFLNVYSMTDDEVRELGKTLADVDMEAKQIDAQGLATLTSNMMETFGSEQLYEELGEDLQACMDNYADALALACTCVCLKFDEYCGESLFS